MGQLAIYSEPKLLLFPERVAPRLGVADMFVEINDEQRYD
jgi:hypothetical protein